jgi:hypothetical protein
MLSRTHAAESCHVFGFSKLFFICALLVFAAGACPIPALAQSCMLSSGSWANASLPQTETGSFRVTYDVTPAASIMNAVTGLSSGSGNEYSDLAVALRFSPDGIIDARNGSGFEAASNVPYLPGVTYHVRLDVNVSAHTYNAYVLVGAIQTSLGTNLGFRTEQSRATSLNNVAALGDTGALTVCNIKLSSVSLPASTSSLKVSTNNVNFGKVSVSESSERQVTVTNTGGADIAISKVSVSGAGFTAGGGAAGLVLGPNESAAVSVTFSPSTSGVLLGTLVISSNATNSLSAIALSGTGISASTSHSVSLFWNSSAAAGYNVYVGQASGGPYRKINSGEIQSTGYTDPSVESGQTYYYVVTALNSANQESGYSSEVSVAIP